MIHPFVQRLRAGPILCDGAMGTQLYARGIPYERCFDELNLTDPDLVQQIHLDYIAAGAEVVETNTFGANRFKLRRFGLEDKVRDINFRAVKIARDFRADRHCDGEREERCQCPHTDKNGRSGQHAANAVAESVKWSHVRGRAASYIGL